MSRDDDALSVVDDAPTITEFYRDKVILLTGFTGFMGKPLVEKLLWSCPDLKLIYVLVRRKKGKTIEQRVKDVIDLRIFNRLRERGDAFMDKIVAIEGDCTLPGLGLSQENREVLRSVNLIFHAAASIRFDDPLPEAINANVYSLKKLLDLGLEMENLECIVPLSTAYVNCQMKDGIRVEEKLYPLPFDWRQALKDSEVIDPKVLATLSYKYMDGMPNTYVFSKRVSEHVLKSYSDKIMSCIIRPSIVTMAFEEPVPGWIDNLNGPVGMAVGMHTGAVRTLLLDENVISDYMPIDVVNRLILISPWWMKYRKYPKQFEIVHSGSNEKSIKSKELCDIGIRHAQKYPLKNSIWTPSAYCTKSVFLFSLYSFLFQLLPSIFIDMFLKLKGHKAVFQKIQTKIYVASLYYSYFTCNFFNFAIDKSLILGQYIKKEDFDDFYFIKDIYDIVSFLEKGTLVAVEVLLKEKLEDRKIAIKRRKIFNLLDTTLKSLFWGLIFWNIYKYQLYIAIPQIIYNSIKHLILIENFS